MEDLRSGRLGYLNSDLNHFMSLTLPNSRLPMHLPLSIALEPEYPCFKFESSLGLNLIPAGSMYIDLEHFARLEDYSEAVLPFLVYELDCHVGCF